MLEKIEKPKFLDPVWTFNDEPISDDIIKNYFGFIYLITNHITGQKYIGKKFFWSTNRKKVKGRKNRKIVTKESDWRKYWSSSADVHSDIWRYGVENFSREIISLHSTKGQVNQNEIEQQFKCNVLTEKLPCGNRMYYNKNIMSRYFVRGEGGDKKHSETMKCKWLQERDYMLSTAFGGVDAIKNRVQKEYDNNTEAAQKRKEHLQKLGERPKHGDKNPMYGKTHSEESRKLIGENRDYSKTNWDSENYKKAHQKNKTKRWLTNDVDSKFVLPEEAELLINQGWRYGRILKKT